ncbi:MAG TPA: response regulator, partial [Candidatus Deferrimicrobium sp.]|nr:response regulator [Candidatus Deferrimicrobium sp.]
DDEPIMRSLLARVVEREGLRALTAASGTEALQLLEANQVRLVISDIVMPDMSGLELLATIKARRPALPVLIITGHASEFRKENVLAAGADGYITKPFKNVEIAQRLASFL